MKHPTLATAHMTPHHAEEDDRAILCFQYKMEEVILANMHRKQYGKKQYACNKTVIVMKLCTDIHFSQGKLQPVWGSLYFSSGSKF